MQLFTIKQLPGSIYGLTYQPSIEPEHDDDADFYGEYHRHVPREFSPANQEVLKKALLDTPNLRCIVEIGVQRNPLPESSTGIILHNKPKECVFIGVDIEDKSHLANAADHVYMLKMNSAERERVYKVMDQLELETIDYLFIDGWHSVNQCLADWRYVERLSPGGVVVMHDTNVHPGPVAVFEAIDDKLFEKVKYCTEGPDWGIAVINKKK